MNLRSVDLNLLVVLDALLDEAHVSRAADRLGLSQPAASSALERCRHLFNDPLLERGKGMMRLTPKAESLRVPIKNLLAEVEAVLDPPAIDLATLRQTVRVVMADYPAVVIVGPLHQELAKSAPGIDLVIRPWHGGPSDALDGLAKGTIDLAASVFPKIDVSFRRHELLQEHYVVMMRKEHPAAAGFNLEKWLAFPHVLVSGRGHTSGALDEALTVYGKERRVGIVVPSFLMVPLLLAQSDLIAMIPSLCVPKDGAKNFALFEPPIPVDGFALHLAWHVRRDQDPAVQHVAGIIQRLLKTPR
ncbi:LysR family transcriptional regulator [Phyllobacterium zundukense]|uniref:LysR family transcriptional regulator n=1 Tax=Phyllobacterium zundukense TaxID=1867719 RepID=A0A2N9VQ46_9HYPH|nr:LysR family transcriptional regulator [Phyllobacterium zundukense]ATU90778.1 LysR family transcriptional regulator [Phyllobacterium zundukense]PIO41614.1 LysR family transcriptional regulator [Phyllobacterium zundukense]